MKNDRRNDRRRDSGRRVDEGGFGLKSALYAAAVILILGLIAFFITNKIYSKNLEKAYSELETQGIGEVATDNSLLDKTQEASSQVGKTVEDQVNELIESSTETEDDSMQTSVVQEEQNKVEDTNVVTNENRKEEPVVVEEPPKDPVFEMPVEGEMIKEFAKDKLVYSETLKEWVVHTGVDIKADKATVVKAAEDGKVTAIKNDPRYGITVIIEHSNGYETRYANLLTAEFVTVGEEVTKGQTIGTVGNTATFEILDDYHLHFEILKDGEYQDPIIFLEY